MRYDARIDDGLGEFGRMFADVAESRSGDPLQRDFRFLDAEDEKWDGACVDDRLRQLGVVARDVAQSPGSRFLHSGVELLQTDDQRVQRSAFHHG